MFEWRRHSPVLSNILLFLLQTFIKHTFICFEHTFFYILAKVAMRLLTFFCCWLSKVRSKSSTLEMSRLSLHSELRPSVRSSRRTRMKAQINFRVLVTRWRMFSPETGQRGVNQGSVDYAAFKLPTVGNLTCDE